MTPAMVAGAARIKPMSKDRNRRQQRPEDQASNWFLTLEIAEVRGDVEATSEALRELDRLGWRVTRKKGRRTPRQKKGVAV
jgi:hypothetical protein